MVQQKRIWLVSMRIRVLSPALLGGSGIQCCCGVGLRCGLDPTFLWLWCRPQQELLHSISYIIFYHGLSQEPRYSSLCCTVRIEPLFDWSIVDLQYCVSFSVYMYICDIYIWLYMCVYDNIYIIYVCVYTHVYRDGYNNIYICIYYRYIKYRYSYIKLTYIIYDI